MNKEFILLALIILFASSSILLADNTKNHDKLYAESTAYQALVDRFAYDGPTFIKGKKSLNDYKGIGKLIHDKAEKFETETRKLTMNGMCLLLTV